MSDLKECAECGCLKRHDAFRLYRGRTRAAICRACRNDRHKQKQAVLREPVNAYKNSRGCADCGWNGHPGALDLDHRPGEDKVHAVSQMIARLRPLEEIMAEVAKCDVVCARCHRLRTLRRHEALR